MSIRCGLSDEVDWLTLADGVLNFELHGQSMKCEAIATQFELYLDEPDMYITSDGKSHYDMGPINTQLTITFNLTSGQISTTEADILSDIKRLRDKIKARKENRKDGKRS